MAHHPAERTPVRQALKVLAKHWEFPAICQVEHVLGLEHGIFERREWLLIGKVHQVAVCSVQTR